MVDAERLMRILARVTTDVATLSAVEAATVRADELALRAAKYSFVTAIEGCVRAAQHVVSAEHLGAPDDNAGAVRMLADAGAVDPDVASRVAKAVGFRNVLVHEYADVDDDRVVENLALVGDLQAFAEQLAAWATRA